MSALTFRRAASADIAAMSALRLAVRENVLSNPGLVTRAMYEDFLERLGRGWVCEQERHRRGHVFARLPLALTHAGSLVGLFGAAVKT